MPSQWEWLLQRFKIDVYKIISLSFVATPWSKLEVLTRAQASWTCATCEDRIYLSCNHLSAYQVNCLVESEPRLDRRFLTTVTFLDDLASLTRQPGSPGRSINMINPSLSLPTLFAGPSFFSTLNLLIYAAYNQCYSTFVLTAMHPLNDT